MTMLDSRTKLPVLTLTDENSTEFKMLFHQVEWRSIRPMRLEIKEVKSLYQQFPLNCKCHFHCDQVSSPECPLELATNLW